MQTVHIWEFGERINVKLNNEFHDRITGEIRRRFRNKRELHTAVITTYRLPVSTFGARLKKGYKYFLDLEIVTALCAILAIPLVEMEKEIISYKTRRGVNEIHDPILPVRISPIIDMLVAHHICDGNVVDPKQDRLPYFSYRQHNAQYMELYKQKIRTVFGDVRYRHPSSDPTRHYFPVVGSALLFKQYRLSTKDFLSLRARIPPQILQRAHGRLAFLIAAIIDEGTVDSTTILIAVKNIALIDDLRRICELQGYEYTVTRRGGRFADFGYLYIRKKGVERFWQDYQLLRQQYPETDLGFKGNLIEQSLNCRYRAIQRKPGNQSAIEQFMTNGPVTANEIAATFQMSRQAARYHLKALQQKGRVEFASRHDGNNRYRRRML